MGSSWDVVAGSLPPTLPGWVIAAAVVVLVGGMAALMLGLRDSVKRFVVGGGGAAALAALVLLSNVAVGRHVDERTVLDQLGRWMTTDRGEPVTPLPAEGVDVDRAARTVKFTAVDTNGEPHRYLMAFPEPVDTAGSSAHVNDSPTLSEVGLLGWP